MQEQKNHYSVQELAAEWGVSAQTIRRIFEDWPGVIRISQPILGRKERKRAPRVTLRIPAVIADAAHRQWAGGARSKVERSHSTV
jgi:Zn-dependent peptidase ImmA (M78 family)